MDPAQFGSINDSDSDDEFYDALVTDEQTTHAHQSEDRHPNTLSRNSTAEQSNENPVFDARDSSEDLTDGKDERIHQSEDNDMDTPPAHPISEQSNENQAFDVRHSNEDFTAGKAEILRKIPAFELSSDSDDEQPDSSEEKLDGLSPERTPNEVPLAMVATETDEDENGGFVSDGEAAEELEKTMTESEKTAKQEEAQISKAKGNDFYKTGDFADAVYAYSRALQLCPLCYKKDRSVMYANRAACKVNQERFDSAIGDCTKALDLNPCYIKVLMRRAKTNELAEKMEDALSDYQQVLELDPACYEARAACMRLPDQIKERNEKMKTEMISKLKDLGNICLRPFGLSTSNFQVNQDPNTGSYSINFNQNPGANNGK